LPVTSPSPISARSSQQHRRRLLKNLALACQPESRTAKLCRLPVARARHLKFEECHLPTLLVFAASPAGPAAPRKLAYQEIARSAVDTERPETGPGVELAPIRPPALRASPPIWVMALAALCSAHVSAFCAQCCTNEKSPPVPSPGIALTNHYYLEEIGFDPQNDVYSASTCQHARRLMAKNQTTPHEIPIHPTGVPPAPPHTQRCTNPKPLPLAALRVIKEKDRSIRATQIPLGVGKCSRSSASCGQTLQNLVANRSFSRQILGGIPGFFKRLAGALVVPLGKGRVAVLQGLLNRIMPCNWSTRKNSPGK
jgi:hypothetical protein